MGTYIIQYCMEDFGSSLDAIAAQGQKLADTVDQLKAAGWDGIVSRAQNIDRSKLPGQLASLYKEAKSVVSNIAKGNVIIQEHALSCLGNGALKNLGLTEVYTTLSDGYDASTKLSKVADNLNKLLDTGSSLGNKVSQLKPTYDSVVAAGKALKKEEKDMQDWAKTESSAARTSAALSESETSLDSRCDLRQADQQLARAGKQGVLALTQARYDRAKARSVMDCWARAAWNYFQAQPTGGHYLVGTGSASVPLWQTMNLGGRSGDWTLDGCTSCRHWLDDRLDYQNAAQAESQLENQLNRIKTQCTTLRSQVNALNNYEDNYPKVYEAGQYALSPGHCNLAAARNAAQTLNKMEQDMRGSSCAPAYEKGYGTELENEILQRSTQQDCSRVQKPIQGPAMPPSSQPQQTTSAPPNAWPFERQLMALCQLQFLPFTDKNGKTWPPDKTTQTHLGLFIHWNQQRRLYFLNWGGATIIGSTPSFSFKHCAIDPDTNPQPACRVVGRDSFHELGGQISVSSGSVSISDQWQDDAAPCCGEKRGTTSCTYNP